MILGKVRPFHNSRMLLLKTAVYLFMGIDLLSKNVGKMTLLSPCVQISITAPHYFYHEGTLKYQIKEQVGISIQSRKLNKRAGSNKRSWWGKNLNINKHAGIN